MPGHGKFASRLLSGAAALAMTAFAGMAQAQEQAQFNIPPQSLASALKEFGLQSGHAVLATPAHAEAKQSPGLTGEADVGEALTRILAGSGLSWRRSGDTFLIVQQGEGGSGPQVGSAVEALIVTAQKREENIQDVPIAISAFSQKALDEQKIEGGFDLLKAIPNVTFSKNNFTSYNFSIRGVGTKAVSATTDPGVAVSFNNTALIQNRLFEQEYFDIERVEVLRGPQGTLYGRNATSGVINVISAKPDLNDFDGWIKGEVGNYHTKRVSAMVNVPLIEDKLGIRIAGALTDRDGYDYNLITRSPVNGRDLWSARFTVGFEPTPGIRANFIWERFEEDDNRSRTGKQVCHHDDGPSMLGSTPVYVPDPGNPYDDAQRILRPALFGQGCKAGSLYDDGAFGTPNGLSIPFIFGLLALGVNQDGGGGATFPLGQDEDGVVRTLLEVRDPYGGMMQSRNLREISSIRDPRYQAKADLFELNVDVDLGDFLTFSSQTAYNEDEVYSFQDFNRFNTVPIFTDTSTLEPYNTGFSNADYSDLAPGGVFCDPQIGCSNRFAAFDISQASAKQFSQEFRLQSSFDGPLNFSAGANYTKFDVLVDYYIMSNLLTAYAMTMPFNAPIDGIVDPSVCVYGDFLTIFGAPGPVPTTDPDSACPYIDPNPVESINGEGHNYFRSKNPYHLKSWAGFGELYWNLTDTLKLTLGLRYNDDQKTFTPIPSQVLLARSIIAGGLVSSGYPEKAPIVQHWREWTGRSVIDWKPDLAFTDETLVYASYSRGYKGGGANPPRPGYATSQEYIDAGVLTAEQIADYESTGVPFPILFLTADEYGDTFKPEFVDAYEIGTKNTLLGGALQFNATAFFYDYKDYQVSQIRDRTAVNENFDAKVWGLEFETVFAPSRDLQIIANLGYLDTKIASGERSIDIMNRTQDNSDYTIVKPWVQLPSNCVIPTHVAEQWLLDNSSFFPYFKLCGGISGLIGGFVGGLYPTVIDPETNQEYDYRNYPELNGGAGLYADIGGNELPNAPHWTANLGAQYGMDVLDGSWRATIRGDVYWQSQSFHRVYNYEPYDKLHGWWNANLSLWIERPDDGLKIELYVKNLLDDTPITDAFLNSDDTGLTTNVFVLDPRLIGLSIRKEF